MKQAVFALGPNGEFGKGQGMPWPHNSEDLRQFKEHTSGMDMIMASKTRKTLPIKGTQTRRFIVIHHDQRTARLEDLKVSTDKYELHRDYGTLLESLEPWVNVSYSIIGGTSLLTPEVLSKLDRLLITWHKKAEPADVYISNRTMDFLKDSDLFKQINVVKQTDDFITLEYIL